jgi:SAM-dependent methyltransferase
MRSLTHENTDTCKICGSASTFKFGLPFNKKANHPIPDEPDDCWYFQCDKCEFLYTRAIDEDVQADIYDDTYWNNQDPDWYGRVSQTLRLVALSNELRQGHLEELEILDFGCGIGGFIESGRSSLNLQIWGTDIIPPKVGKDYVLADLGDRKFDVIVACEVIEHLPDPVTVMKFIRSHLKSPGVFAFQTAQWDPRSLNRDWWYLGPHNGHISLYSAGALDHMFERLGGVKRRSWGGYMGVQAWLFR